MVAMSLYPAVPLTKILSIIFVTVESAIGASRFRNGTSEVSRMILHLGKWNDVSLSGRMFQSLNCVFGPGEDVFKLERT